MRDGAGRGDSVVKFLFGVVVGVGISALAVGFYLRSLGNRIGKGLARVKASVLHQ